jgi:hypothetical protein
VARYDAELSGLLLTNLMQAVEIQSVKTRALHMMAVIVIPQPANEIEDVRVAPHRCRKSLEACKRVDRVVIRAFGADELFSSELSVGARQKLGLGRRLQGIG